MSGTVTPEPVPPAPPAPTVPPGPRRPRTTLHGIRTVAQHEFRVRLRAGRWRWMLASWIVVLALLTFLLAKAVDAQYEEAVTGLGIPVFGGLVIGLLGLSLLVVPALTAQSVNGDRERGVLATLQVTLLTPAEIALGKLAAAWVVSLVFLGAAVPMVAATMAMGGVPLGQVLPTMLVLAVLLGVVAAISQCLSALLARTMTSAVLSYAAVFALTVGTLITFALALPITTETVQHTYMEPRYDDRGEIIPGSEQPVTYESERTREDKVWWLLGPNPFVILADSAPRLPRRLDQLTGEPVASPLDPLGDLGNAVRDARRPPMEVVTYGPLSDERPPQPGPVWPYGLAVDVALAGLAVLVTVRRLRTPVNRLPRGVRIA